VTKRHQIRVPEEVLADESLAERTRELGQMAVEYAGVADCPELRESAQGRLATADD